MMPLGNSENLMEALSSTHLYVAAGLAPAVDIPAVDISPEFHPGMEV